MMNDYEIHIGSIRTFGEGSEEPKQVIQINKSQFDIIEVFASIVIDEDLHRVYTLNNISFKVVPVIYPKDSKPNYTDEPLPQCGVKGCANRSHSCGMNCRRGN